MMSLRCWTTRWQLSSALDRGEQGDRTSAHVASCARCAAYARALGALDKKLRINGVAPPAPSFSPTPSSPPIVQSARWRWAIAGGSLATAFVLVAIITTRGGAPGPSQLHGDAAATSRTALSTVPPSDGAESTNEPTLTATLSRAVTHSTSLALSTASLRREFNALADDSVRGARAVLRVSGLDPSLLD